jgi:Right handed beta helix region
MNSDLFIKECTFAFFKSGGIMVQALPQNQIYISDNQIISCETNGVYIQGRATRATVKGNKINFNHCTAIFISVDVDANVSKHTILELQHLQLKAMLTYYRSFAMK